MNEEKVAKPAEKPLSKFPKMERRLIPLKDGRSVYYLICECGWQVEDRTGGDTARATRAEMRHRFEHLEKGK